MVSQSCFTREVGSQIAQLALKDFKSAELLLLWPTLTRQCNATELEPKRSSGEFFPTRACAVSGSQREFRILLIALSSGQQAASMQLVTD